MGLVLTTEGNITEDVSVGEEWNNIDHKMVYFPLKVTDLIKISCRIRKLNCWRADFHTFYISQGEFGRLTGNKMETCCKLLKNDFTRKQSTSFPTRAFNIWRDLKSEWFDRKIGKKCLKREDALGNFEEYICFRKRVKPQVRAAEHAVEI